MNFKSTSDLGISLTKLSDLQNVAFVLISHPTKSKRSTDTLNYYGSVALGNLASTIFEIVAYPRRKGYAFLKIKKD